ncbi:hypothetical protein B0H16DRAFT_1711340 [Mycena metata]|uniref:Uncharacterized protein n=1 Tax=Mycena metata TaxID=1033252 RepID=A0AAD7K652_9AGAR|nr:hypothetical protein B0H16DRAFT_1711340 [Mycena metata]
MHSDRKGVFASSQHRRLAARRDSASLGLCAPDAPSSAAAGSSSDPHPALDPACRALRHHQRRRRYDSVSGDADRDAEIIQVDEDEEQEPMLVGSGSGPFASGHGSGSDSSAHGDEDALDMSFSSTRPSDDDLSSDSAPANLDAELDDACRSPPGASASSHSSGSSPSSPPPVPPPPRPSSSPPPASRCVITPFLSLLPLPLPLARIPTRTITPNTPP